MDILNKLYEDNERFYIHRDEVKRIIEGIKKEAVKIGTKKAKKDIVDYIYIMPGLSENEKGTYMRELVHRNLITARNFLLRQIFKMTIKQIYNEEKKYNPKELFHKCCECDKENVECKRLCPTDCPNYKKPCGK